MARLFSHAASDKLDLGSPAVLDNLMQSQCTTIFVVDRRTADTTNLYKANKASSFGQGWSFYNSHRGGTGFGYNHFVIWGASATGVFKGRVGSSGIGSDVQTLNTDWIACAEWDQTTIKIFQSALGTGLITEVSGYLDDAVVAASAGADASDNYYAWNTQQSNQPFTGHAQWQIVYHRATVLTLSEKRQVQMAVLAYEAGDTTRAIAMFKDIPGYVLLGRLAYDGTFTDFSGNSITGSLTGSSAGSGINDDTSGVSLGLVHSLKTWEDDAETLAGLGEQTKYWYTSSSARARFTTASSSVSLFGYSTYPNSTQAAQQAVGVVNNNAYAGQVLSNSAVGYFRGTVSSLASGIVEIINSPRSRWATPPAATEPQLGAFGSIAVFSATASLIAATPRRARVMMLTDSIWDQFVATPPHQYGAMSLYRRALPQEYDAIVQCGYGGAALVSYTTNGATQTANVNRLLNGGTTAVVVLSFGINDKYHVTLTKAQFESRLGSLVDEILARSDFRGRIVLISPTMTNLESANANGDTMDDFRTAMRNVQNTRAARVSYIDGLLCVSYTNVSADNIHFNNTGQAQMYDSLCNALRPGATRAFARAGRRAL